MVPTPFSPDGTRLDLASLERLATALLDDGCAGLVALGVIAEPGTLSEGERREVVSCLAALTRPRGADLVVSVLSLGTDDAVDQVRRSAELRAGAAAVLVPVTSGDHRGLRRHLRAVHAAADVPIVVQDLPRSTGIVIETDELLRALDGLDFVAAVKCESPPTSTAVAALARHSDVVPMSGMGGVGLVADLHAGARAVALGATPTRSLVRAVEAWERGDVAASLAAVGAVAARCHVETQPGAAIAIRKEHWRREGRIASATVRPPTVAWDSRVSGLSDLLGVGIRP